MKSLTQTSAVYTIASAANALISMATFFVLARSLSVTSLGYIALFTSLVPLFTAIANSGMPSALNYYYYYKKPDEEYRSKHIACAFWYALMISLLIVGILLILKKQAISFLELSASTTVYFYYALALFFLELIFGFFTNLSRVRFASIEYVGLLISRNGLTCLLLAMAYLYRGSFDLTLYFIFSYTGLLLPQVYLVIKNAAILSPRHLDPLIFKKMFAYGSPLLFGGAAVYFINYADRVVIQKVATTEELGFYFVAFKVAMILGLITQGFKSAWAPSMLKSALAENNTDIIPVSLRYYLAVTLFLLVFVASFAKEIIWILAGQQYESAAPVVVFLGTASLLFGAYDILHSGIVLSKKLIFHSIIMITSGATNLALNFVFVSYWGIVGAAVATASSSLLAAGLAFYFSQKFFPVNFNSKQLLYAVVLLILTIIVIYKISLLSLPLRVAGCMLCLFFVTTLFKKEIGKIHREFTQRVQNFMANGIT